jgi:hypothetical protein
VIDFIETNHRNPSKHRIEEHNMLNWVKQQRKLHNAEADTFLSPASPNQIFSVVHFIPIQVAHLFRYYHFLKEK